VPRINKNINLLFTRRKSRRPAIDMHDYVGRRSGIDEGEKTGSCFFLWAQWCGDCKAQSAVARARLAALSLARA